MTHCVPPADGPENHFITPAKEKAPFRLPPAVAVPFAAAASLGELVRSPRIPNGVLEDSDGLFSAVCALDISEEEVAVTLLNEGTGIPLLAITKEAACCCSARVPAA